MATDRSDEIYDKLKDHSIKLSGETTKLALLDQRLTALEILVERYHLRLHETEKENMTIKVVQQVHDVQISSFKKALMGNGNKDSIPMDIQRIEGDIQGILKVNWVQIQTDLEILKKFKDREWQVWVIVIGLIVSNLWQLFVK